MALTVVGCDSWQDASDICEGTELEKSVTNCIKTVNWDNLLKLCLELRGGIKCKISTKFSVGTHNLVKLVDFTDGTKWVARISLQVDDDIMAASNQERIDGEVAILKYLSLHSSIPVPEVYAFNPTSSNDIGAPYMLITYIHGTIADDIDLDENQYQKVQKQVAETMIELASLKFDRIGYMTMDKEGNFKIGKHLETNGGPYATAGEYYSALSKHRFKVYTGTFFANNLEAQEETGVFLPLIFDSLMQMMTNYATDTGPFSLRHSDIGSHNILLDADLNLVGLIDCADLFPAPIHEVAQVPRMGGMEVPPPGLVTRKPLFRQTYERGRPNYEKFLRIFEETEKRMTGKTELAEAMVSDGALLFEQLENYAQFQEALNAKSIRSYLYTYFRAFHGSSRAKEFSEAPSPQDTSDDDDESERSEESEQANQDSIEEEINSRESESKEERNETAAVTNNEHSDAGSEHEEAIEAVLVINNPPQLSTESTTQAQESSSAEEPEKQ